MCALSYAGYYVGHKRGVITGIQFTARYFILKGCAEIPKYRI